MNTERILTVREALSRPLFASAVLVAGENGLHRQIRWVHILEINDFEMLIHGEEMILTIGMSFNLNAASSVTFVEKLIRQKASCLCIELGSYFQSVPDELLELADRHAFPVILFPHTVRFVDITQDLHSLIINRHHLMLQELERLSRQFHRLTLHAQGTPNILKLLHRCTQAQLVYRPLDGKPLFCPPLTPEQQLPLLQMADAWCGEPGSLKPDAAPTVQEYRNGQAVLKPVGALDQTWACLLMVCGHTPQEYDYLLLDSASLALAQELLRNRYMEERKLYSEQMWIDELLSGPIEDERLLKGMLGSDFKRLNDLNFCVCLVEIENDYDEHLSILADSSGSEGEQEPILVQLSLILRSTFKNHGFRPFLTRKNNRLAVIALDTKSKVGTKLRLQEALTSFQAALNDAKLKGVKTRIGVGKFYNHLKNAYRSYQEASQALSLHACFRQPVLFFEELGVYQLLLGLNDGHTLEQFVRSYLGPLIDHDESKGCELLYTLKVYLDNDGSKQIASQKLFIVRQSLYYRLEKITELLGRDFISPENRISIQVALRAYQLLHPDKFQDANQPASDKTS